MILALIMEWALFQSLPNWTSLLQTLLAIDTMKCFIIRFLGSLSLFCVVCFLGSPSAHCFSSILFYSLSWAGFIHSWGVNCHLYVCDSQMCTSISTFLLTSHSTKTRYLQNWPQYPPSNLTFLFPPTQSHKLPKPQVWPSPYTFKFLHCPLTPQPIT